MLRKITIAVAVVACAAALGLTLPDAHAGAATSTGTPLLPSAYGCNLNTCIEIDGSGTTVLAIYGQTQNPFSKSVTTTGTVYDNGTAIHKFPAVTLKPGGGVTQLWNSPSYKFRSGDQVCVRYSGISGYPCETIG